MKATLIWGWSKGLALRNGGELCSTVQTKRVAGRGGLVQDRADSRVM